MPFLVKVTGIVKCSKEKTHIPEIGSSTQTSPKTRLNELKMIRGRKECFYSTNTTNTLGHGPRCCWEVLMYAILGQSG